MLPEAGGASACLVSQRLVPSCRAGHPCDSRVAQRFRAQPGLAVPPSHFSVNIADKGLSRPVRRRLLRDCCRAWRSLLRPHNLQLAARVPAGCRGSAQRGLRSLGWGVRPACFQSFSQCQRPGYSGRRWPNWWASIRIWPRWWASWAKM